MVNKRIQNITIILTLLLVLTIPVAIGGNQTVYIPMNNDATGDIVVSPTTWEHYESLLGTSVSTNLTDFTLDNNGSVQVDVVVSGNNSQGWVISNDPGYNQYAIDFRIDGDWQEIISSPSTFSSDLAHNESIQFGLQLYLPINTSETTMQNWIITFEATAD